MKLLAITVRVFKYLVLLVVLTVVLGLVWLRWESHQPRDDWFVERHGELAGIASESSVTRHGQPSQQVTLQSDSGLIDCQRLCRLMLERCKTAREAIELAGELTARYGWNDYGECLTIADKREVWHFEILGPGKGKVALLFAHIGVAAH